jgi:hypothetical protein
MKIKGARVKMQGQRTKARQMQKGEEGGWKLKGGGFRMSIRVRQLGGLLFIYTTGSVHRFKWSNRNRTEPARFYGFKNRFNRFFISVRFSRLIFYRFSRFFRLISFFEHP